MLQSLQAKLASFSTESRKFLNVLCIIIELLLTMIQFRLESMIMHCTQFLGSLWLDIFFHRYYIIHVNSSQLTSLCHDSVSLFISFNKNILLNLINRETELLYYF